MKCGDVLCACQGTYLIVCGCPALRTLVVNKYTTVGASSRGFIAKLRPELQLLVHDDSTEYDILAMSID